MKLCCPACFYPCEEKKGGYTVEFPDLPGCVTEGGDLAEAILMAQDAACGWVLDELESGNEAPAARAAAEITPDDGGFVSLVALDIDSYAEKYGSNAVRKNLTIPAWLSTAAEKKNVNFSQILANALQKELELA